MIPCVFPSETMCFFYPIIYIIYKYHKLLHMVYRNVPTIRRLCRSTGADLDPSFGSGRRDDPAGVAYPRHVGWKMFKGLLIEVRYVYIFIWI